MRPILQALLLCKVDELLSANGGGKSDEDEFFRRISLTDWLHETLLRMGQGAVPALRLTIQDEDENIRRIAANILEEIERESSEGSKQ